MRINRSKLIVGVVFCVALLSMSIVALAATKVITIKGRESTLVVSSIITLGDIADVASSMSHTHDDAIVALKNTKIAMSPAPGKEKEIQATELLQVLRANQVNLEEIGYTLPIAMKIKRASRTVSNSEIMYAITNAINEMDGDEIKLKDLIIDSPLEVAPSMTSYTAKALGEARSGKMAFNIIASSPEGETQVLPVQAYVEQWAAVPIAKRPITKGAIVNDGDIGLARLNVQMIPKDALRKGQELIGLEASQDIGYGDYFRTKSVGIPTLVNSGELVTAVVKSNLLEVTLRARALDAGGLGNEVRLRNDTSKKVLRGKVVAEKMVEVLQ